MKKIVILLSFVALVFTGTSVLCDEKAKIDEIEQWEMDSILKIETFGKYCPEQFAAFVNFVKSIKENTVLDPKTIELIQVAIGIKAQSAPCIFYHTKAALGAGATKEELLHTGMIAVVMGGGNSYAQLQHLIKAIDAFDEEE
jgi:AhpD family alkylhydroperoxidase